MKVAYQRVVEVERVPAHINALAPRTVVFDVEPLVAFWDTDHDTLVGGVAAILDRIISEVAGVQEVVFATNSQRRLLPRPGVVVGDQVATDGVLAWRLGYSFLHFRPRPAETPLGPRVMNLLGRPLRPLLFTRGTP